MALLETVTLDGLALNDNTNFQLIRFDPVPAPKNYRWIEGEDADGAVLAEKPHRGNRAWECTVRVMPQATMDAALAKLGQIIDKLEECENHETGLAGTWTPGADSTKSLTFNVYSGEITGLPVSHESGWWKKRPEITFVLHADPFLEGAEVLNAATVTSSDPVQILTVPNVTGDAPAKARLVVIDNATQSRRHVEWGLQWRYYDAATSLLIDSTSLTTSGFSGTTATRTGAYSGGTNNVIRGTLTATPVAICGTGNLSHVGTFRVKARVYAAPVSDATAGDFHVRLSWKEGDGPLRSNAYTSPTATGGWSEIDLGIISIPEKELGTQRWTGQIEAYSEDAGDTLDVDYIVLIPAGEGYGKARAPITFETVMSFSARDEFNQTAGALTGKAAAVGGNWAGAGDADDFSVETTGKTAQRTAVSDANEATGRYAVSGVAAYAAQIVQVDFKASAVTAIGGALQGVLARYASTSAYVMIVLRPKTATLGPQVHFLKKVAGVETFLGADADVSFTVGQWYTLRVLVDASGAWAVWYFPQGGRAGSPIGSGVDSALATGGALASGKPGFYDAYVEASAITRNYDNFVAAVPAGDATVYSGQSAEIRSDSAIREDATGTYWGPVSSYRGARFFLPPAGDENRISRILVESRRNDIDLAPDDQIADSTNVVVHYTPRWSVVPR